MTGNGETILPAGPLVAWYGDDFTGAAAVMEVLSFAGLDSVLFLETPTREQLARFPGARGIGIAGVARSKSPGWMETELPPVFSAMAGYGAPVNQYKICSTLDSAPHVGSIGRASELAAPKLGGAWHPFLVAAPPMQRYQAFGNLFAGASGTVYRLDRHPVMSRHPVTPMDEADVRRHLARQTDLPVGLVTVADLATGAGDAALERERDAGAQIVAFDCVDDATLAEAGRLIWQNRGDKLFVIGSQGVEYALVAHWREAGLLDDVEPPAHPGRVERVAVVSGSCSPLNGQQIEHAAAHGFTPIRIDPAHAVDEVAWKAEIARAGAEALRCLGEGNDPLIHTATGPDDPANTRFREAVDASGRDAGDVNEAVGKGLGALLGHLIETAKLKRATIAGGDTSGHGASVLGIYALTALAPVATGAALCRAHSDNPALADFQIALKGGQMGGPDFFELVKNGGLAA